MLIGSSAGWWECQLDDVVIYGSFTWWLVVIDAVFAIEQAFVKLAAVQQVFGWTQGFLSVPRTLWLNCINLCATSMAIYKFAKCRMTGRPLRWAKTAHEFPTIQAAPARRRRLGEVLIDEGTLSQQSLDDALAEQRRTHERLGRVMVRLQLVTEETLTAGLAKQLGMRAAEGNPFAV